MSDKPYTNADLDAAEDRLVGLGRDGEAAALRHYTQGIRNLVQGEWGQSFLGALESISARQAQTIVGALQGDLLALRGEVGALGEQFHSEVKTLSERMDASEADRRQINERLDRIERLLSLEARDGN